MHICCVILSLQAGGAERVMSNLAGHWVESGHRVSLLTLESPDIKPFYPISPKIELTQLGFDTEKSSLWLIKQIRILRYILRLRKKIKKSKPDIIISFIDLMNIATLCASYRLNIPVIISERIDPAHHPLPSLYKWLRFKIYPLASKLVVQTKSSASYFPKSFTKFIQIIPNPVSVPKKIKGSHSRQVKKIITIGRLDKQKDHKTLILAFVNLLKRYNNLQLTIYGEGLERKNLESIIKDFGLQNKIFLPGTTNNIKEALLESDLFIFPSLYEGFPNALTEAMAVGLPVIASNCSGNVDIIQDGVNGRLFPVRDVKALTDITLELIDTLEEREKLSKNSKKITEQFSCEHIFNEWDNSISLIIQTK